MRYTQVNSRAFQDSHEPRFPFPPNRHQCTLGRHASTMNNGLEGTAIIGLHPLLHVTRVFTTDISPSRVQELFAGHADLINNVQDGSASTKEYNGRCPSNCENSGHCAMRKM
jgi:hypothetical protein